MTNQRVPERIRELALKMLEDEVALGYYPSSEWRELAPGWELHFWFEDRERAAIVPVRWDGSTKEVTDSIQLEMFHSFQRTAGRSWKCRDCGETTAGSYPQHLTLCSVKKEKLL